MTQLNTPYPATSYLTGFLRARGFQVEQRDPAIELIHRLFSSAGLAELVEELTANFEGESPEDIPEVVISFMNHQEEYLTTVDPTIRFLQGKDPSLASRISRRQYLPEHIGFEGLHQMEDIEGPNYLLNAFGTIGTQDLAKYLASQYLAGLAKVIKEGIDPRFDLTRYGERLAASNPIFDDLHHAVHHQESLVDDFLVEITKEHLATVKPTVVGITVPFPGNMYGALRIAKTIKEYDESIHVVLGGGYVNTELRELKDTRVFEFIDFITVDDGERPLLTLLEVLDQQRNSDKLFRTYHVQGEAVSYVSNPSDHDIPHKDIGTPCYEGLPLDLYLSICELPNPMHRIWSDGRWNKLTLAHGCYWNQCSFCDTSLDYIARYDEAHAEILLSRMEDIIAQTGQTGFHLVDEAAPPKVMLALAQKIIAKGLTVTWWGNVRFEKTFTPKVAEILAASGCIAVSGGLEVASDRLLKLMNKGVSVKQVAKVTQAFSQAGILVHAYLMYGFPTQTTKETIESLERVRQLFANNCIQSAYWHRFAATVHSPIGKNPEKFGIELLPLPSIEFATNDVEFHDPTGTDHDMLGVGLNRALYNYMNGIGLEEPLDIWFDQRIPSVNLPHDYISSALHSPSS